MLGAVVGVSLAGCANAGLSQGSYPIDFFTEMHYNPSFKVQEPPSLSAPREAVPITGREASYTLDQARELQNPLPADQATLSLGARVFEVNCAVCHGAAGQGDGPMRERLTTAGYGRTPADLTGSGPTVAKTDGEVYWIIARGFAGAYGLPAEVFVMPPFAKLLTLEERWALLRYIRSLQ